MPSSQNIAAIDSWLPRPTLTDSWLADYFSRDTDALTKALNKSINAEETNAAYFLNAAATPTVSSLSGSDQDSLPKRRPPPPPTGKVSKRKSRASKRSQTTFITADPANFRQMVQQVTGVRFDGGPIAPAVLKPEPQRPAGRLTGGAGFLPTLDTSAFLLEHQAVGGGPGPGPGPGPGAGLSGAGPLPLAPALEGAASFGSSADFDIFSHFPTLESWKVL